MKRHWGSLFLIPSFFICGSSAVMAQNPCLEPHARALVLGGGGSKGAFEAGAAYHLITHRGCDFVEISGTSAGALNGAVLAQAEATADPVRSRERLMEQAESLVNLWTSIKSTRDVLKSRRFATLRFGLFGLEGMKDFGPLRQLIGNRVALERLETGRELRVGTISFHDGRYHEIVINPRGKVDPHTAHAFIFGSAIVPVFGTMPRIPQHPTQRPQDSPQFGDGGIRHSTPVNSYFKICQMTVKSENGVAAPCTALGAENTPPHGRIEQLFIVLTTPYERKNDLRPVVNPKAFKPGTSQITDGRLVMARTLDLLVDSIYRSDLDEMLLANDLLLWRGDLPAPAGPVRRFPVESYNVDPSRPDVPSLPYRIAMVIPGREDADPTTMFDLRPETISRQLYCGCLAADEMMQREFELTTMSGQCAEKFPRRTKAGMAPWEAAICREPQRAAATPVTSGRQPTNGTR